MSWLVALYTVLDSTIFCVWRRHACYRSVCLVGRAAVISGGGGRASHVRVRGARAAQRRAVSADQLRTAALPDEIPEWGAVPAVGQCRGRGGGGALLGQCGEERLPGTQLDAEPLGAAARGRWRWLPGQLPVRDAHGGAGAGAEAGQLQ